MYDGIIQPTGKEAPISSKTSQADEVVTQSHEVEPKARFIGNPTNELIIIPDLRNEVDEEGLTINPGDKIDLTLYYSAKEINRSRGLDKMINGAFERPSGKQITPPKLVVLNSLNDELSEVPKPFSEQQNPGSSFEAAPNFADDNLAKLDFEEQKELDKIRSKNKHTR